MLGLIQNPQRVLLHKQQKRPRTFLAILKYVAALEPTDQFRHSNRPIECSTQLSRYNGRYHEQLLLLLLAILKYVAALKSTDQFRHSNRPIRCSTQLSRYNGRYHEQLLLLLLLLCS